jgi:2-polyprenyl-3-methyl-5-hydroxy-6-metoxy-1,4-benzoquinol methylase
MTADERKIIRKAKLEELSEHLSLEAHVKRYRFVRPYAYGRVLDCACGVGYGSHLISQNPDVTKVVGVDVDQQSISIAEMEYSSNKVAFVCADLRAFTDPVGFDVLISIETIEHLDEPRDLKALAVRNRVRMLMLSFPAFKSTHTNPFHKHDIALDEARRILSPEYSVTDAFNYLREVWFVFLVDARANPGKQKDCCESRIT